MISMIIFEELILGSCYYHYSERSSCNVIGHQISILRIAINGKFHFAPPIIIEDNKFISESESGDM